MQGQSFNRDTLSRLRFLVYPPRTTPEVDSRVCSGYLIRLSFASDVLDEPDGPPRHATSSCESPQGTGLICLVYCVAEEVGYVFVEGDDVDPHARAVKGRGCRRLGVSD